VKTNKQKIIQELAEKLNIHCRVAFSKNKPEAKKLFNSFNFHKSQQLSAGLKNSLSETLIEERREEPLMTNYCNPFLNKKA
jgi:hypothetical protein